MTRRFFRVATALVAFCLAADLAQASLLPPPLTFSFFTPGLMEWFLLPFTLAGCEPMT